MINKFRVWDDKLKNMTDPFTLEEAINDTDFWGDEYGLSGRKIYMQYIWHKDKNGNELYTDDIIQGIGRNKGIRKVVDMHTFCGHPNIPSSKFVRIGNTHTTPELLEDK